tara:strand:- start:2005 stop:2652 length:648 start_codon:yes stop_codon:yes gene_type:complete
MSDSQLLAGMFTAISSTDPDGAYDVILKVSARMDEDKTKKNTARIPDCGCRKALESWGLKFRETTPISRMIGSVKCLEVDLPENWKVENRGPWNYLNDDQGRRRLRWYIHGWDRVSVQTCNRFSVRDKDLGPRSRVYQVLDGDVAIYVESCNMPHARLREKYDDGSCGWHLSNDEESREARTENYKAGEAASEKARTWLNENREGWRNDLVSWTL